MASHESKLPRSCRRGEGDKAGCEDAGGKRVKVSRW